MNIEIAIVLGILGGAIVLFAKSRFGPDTVALLIVLSLILTRSLSASDALAGFSSPAVIAIACIFLVTAGLARTGVAAWIGKHLLRIAGPRQSHQVALAAASAATLSLVMNNIASASVLLPALSSLARQTKTSPSKLLIPLSFGTILGGMATLFTTINLLVNDALASRGLTPFSLWDFFRIGSIITAAGILYMATLGRRLLPDYPQKDAAPLRRLPDELTRIYEIPERLFEVRVPGGSRLDGTTIADSRLGQKYDLSLLGYLREGRIRLSPSKEDTLQAGDVLILKGESDRLQDGMKELGLALEPMESATDIGLTDWDIGIIEVVVSPYAGIVGRSLREIRFRERFGLTVMSIRREGNLVQKGLPDIRLRFGDALLIQGPRDRLRLLSTGQDFIMLDEPDKPDNDMHPEKAPWAIAALILMVLATSFNFLPISAAALLAGMVLVLTGALNLEDGYRAVEWRAVVMIGGMLSMGAALEKSGAAALLSSSLLGGLGVLGPLALLAGLYAVSMLLAQAISGAATAVLTMPIALSAAGQLGISPYPLMMAIVIGSSSAFITPMSHPANILVMGPGDYRFGDYARVGGYLSLLVAGITLILVPLFWPF